MKKLLVLGTILLSTSIAAQYPGEGEVVGTASKFNPIPSTPNVAAFEKYGNMPVNANTGVPQISVPIHQIQLNGFTWPIQLSYHAGGFKSTDVATRNGLGWTLQASGIVSIPSTAGLLDVEPDAGELDLTFNCNSSPSTSPYCDPNDSWDMNYANAVLAGTYSSDIGIYNANLANGISGKFTNTGVALPASDIFFGATLIIDTKGNRYEFLAQGSNMRTSVCLGMQQPTNSYSNNLTKIITAKGQTIEFVYDTEEYEYELPPLHIIKTLNSGQVTQCNAQYDNVNYYCTNNFEAQEKRLKKIQSSTGEVVYFYYSSRSDLPGSSKMDSLKIWYKTGSDSVLIKKASFNYSYFGTGSDPDYLQLKLNQVGITGSTSSPVNEYKFKYDTTNSLPAKTDQVRNFSGLVFDGFNISTAGIIKEIEYPTGGFTKFEFETESAYGILKVTKIWDSTGTGGVSNIRAFEYSGIAITTGAPDFTDDETVYYFGMPGPVDCEEHSPCEAPNDWLQSCNATVWKSEPIPYPGEEYADPSPRFVYVTEKFGLNGENGKTEYVYSLPSITRDVYDVIYLNPEYLAVQKNYKKNADNSYSMLSQNINSYEVPSSTNTYWGYAEHARETRMYARKISVLRPEMRLPCCNCQGEGCMSYYSFSPIYQEIGRRVSSVPVYLKSNLAIQYSGSDSIMVQTNYYYNDAGTLQPVRIETTNSRGELLSTKYKYPYHFIGTEVYDTMVARNRIDDLIEKIDSNITLATEIARSKTNYQLWMSNVLAEPSTIQKSLAGNSLTTEVTIQGFDDKANLRQMTLKDGLINSFIWDYDKNDLIAEAKNADTSSIAATSFEADGKGGWSYSGSVNTTYALTGTKCYLLSGGDITKTGLSNTTYIISYWGRSGSVNVNSAGPARTGKTVGSWTYYEHEITGTSITLSGSNYIDELRLYPKGALMTSYTYTPLHQIQSLSDIKGHTQFYEYDNFNRLKLIKDEDGNIVKRFDYKYKSNYQE